MRDALGGTVTLVIIVVFIVVALGYMAFNVNYTKAFRMKNKVIAVYEDYDGICGQDCQEEISNYSNEIGYTLGKINCPSGYTKQSDIYCIRVQDVASNDYNRYKSKSSITHIKNKGGTTNALSDVNRQQYYSVITRINVDIPIINKVLDFRFFYITGDTKAFDID